MAGSFGYEATHYDVSMQMAELSLLPAVRKAEPNTLLVADGTSCRHQIADGAGRQAEHVASVLARALAYALGVVFGDEDKDATWARLPPQGTASNTTVFAHDTSG